ncbi:hypothetical protein GCM10020254_43410 [Streptomyces goshikiensis]
MSVVTNTTTIGAIELPSRRNTELLLLGFAVVIPIFAYANVGLAIHGELPPGMFLYGLGLGALAGVAHLVVRRYAKYADPLLLPIATLLNGLGLVLIWRLDQSERLQNLAKRQFGLFTESAPGRCSTRRSPSPCSPSCCWSSRTTACSSGSRTSPWPPRSSC